MIKLKSALPFITLPFHVPQSQTFGMFTSNVLVRTNPRLIFDAWISNPSASNESFDAFKASSSDIL
jgi:hypothetical protein